MMNLPVSHAAIEALGWTLVHFLWQGVAVAVLVALLRAAFHSSRGRYAIAVSALLTCAVLPVVTFLTSLPAPLPAPQAIPVTAEAPSRATNDSPSVTLSSPVPAPLPVPDFHIFAPGPLEILHRYLPTVVALWMAGVVLMAGRLLGGCWTIHRLRRVGISPLPEHWRARVRALSRSVGVRRSVEVVASAVVKVPIVVGVLRPMILMPVATVLGLTHDQLETILIHELEHVRRYDGLVNLLQRLVETILFYHPAVWWISGRVRIEREHCCDDAVAARVDARTYAGALATLEELRAPALAVAASEGPLLSRVRRLLTIDLESRQPARVTLPQAFGMLAIVSVAVAVGAIRSSSATQEEPMANQEHPLPGTLLEGVRVPTRGDVAGDAMGGEVGAFSTIVDAYVVALAAAGDEWSTARVAATFGYPFHFVMMAGAAYHDHNCNIETWWFFDTMNDLGWKTVSFQEFTGAGNEPSDELPALREQAWEAVTASIDRGMPAIAWSPRPDHHFSDWGLLVGYDRGTKSYHVSHVQTDSVYSISYDDFGQAWFNVIVFTERTGADQRAAEIATLRHAVEFSKGLRYSVEDSKNCGEVDAIGFDAYQLWIDALASGNFDGSLARSHAWQLYHTRRLAAEYTREAARRLDGAPGARLVVASDHYVQVSELSRQLLDIVADWTADPPPESEVAEARELLRTAMEWERGAVMFLEVALLNLGEQIPGEPTNPGVATLQGEPPVQVEVDVAPTEPHRGTTLASSLEPVLQALGRTGWTPARIQGVLGHLFHFQMAEGGGDVWHDNLDWSLALEVLPEVAQYRNYEATKESSDADRVAAKEEARDAVRASLDRGIPALVWNPRSAEQRQSGHPGGHGVCWGLIVGYDEARETYTIRHPFVWQGDYTIRYDEIGETDGAEWLSVMVFEAAKSADDQALHRMALKHAISFADGTRLGKHRWTQGLEAYETWLTAFESTDLPDITHHHANMLEARRELAAEYLQDLSEILPDAAEPLAAAAAHYEREHAPLVKLSMLTDEGRSRGYTVEDRAEMKRLLHAALDEERSAVEQIRTALRALGEDVPTSPARRAPSQERHR